MEWLRKLLEAATIKDGVLDVSALMTSINAEFPKNAVPKETYNSLSDQLKERDKQIKQFSEKAKGNEELEKQLKEAQEANKKTADEYQAKVRQMAIDRAIEKELEGCKHTGLLSKEYDTKALEFNEDGSIKNPDVLSVQTKTFKEETYKDFWTQTIGGKTPPNSGTSSSGAKDPGEMSMEEYSAWYNERNK